MWSEGLPPLRGCSWSSPVALHSPYLSVFKVVMGPDCLSTTFVLNRSSCDRQQPSGIFYRLPLQMSAVARKLEGQRLDLGIFPQEQFTPPPPPHIPQTPANFLFFLFPPPLFFLSARFLNVMVQHPPPKPATTSSPSSPTLSAQPPTFPYIC